MGELEDLLNAQGGQVTWSDAVRAGVTRREVQAALRAGRLAHVGHRAYIDARGITAQERHRRRAMALLRAQPGRVATHHTAAVLLGLPVHGAELDTIHCGRAGTSGRRGRDWVLHRLPREVATRQVGTDGLEVSTVSAEVAALQCALLVGRRSGLVTIDAALRQGSREGDRSREAVRSRADARARTQAEVAAALKTYARTPRIAVARSAFELGDYRRESPAESLAAYELHVLRIPVTPQWPITLEGRHVRADFRVDGTNVLIEVDGMGKYADPDALRAEKRREQALRHAGYEIVRLTWEDLGNRAKIRALVEAAKARCAGRPLLP